MTARYSFGIRLPEEIPLVAVKCELVDGCLIYIEVCQLVDSELCFIKKEEC